MIRVLIGKQKGGAVPLLNNSRGKRSGERERRKVEEERKERGEERKPEELRTHQSS